MAGHPLHPIAVHFPVVLLIGGVLIDILSAWLVAWRKAGFFHLVLGTAAAVAALLTGGLDARTVPAGAGALIQSHTVFAILATLAFALMAAGRIYFRIRYGRSGGLGDPEASVPAPWATAYFAFAAVGVLLMVATGFTGGELVYGHGVGSIAGR